MKWTNVNQELPPIGELVLVFNTEGARLTGRWLLGPNDQVVWTAFFSDGEREMNELAPSHWMPLPAAPNYEDAGQAPKTFTLEELNKISDDKELVAGIDQLVEKISAEINHPLSEISQHYLWGAKRVANFVKNIITGKKYI